MRHRYNYDKLKGKIVEKCGNQKTFAEKEKISANTLSSKLQGKREWTQDEIYNAIEILEIPGKEVYEYFFCRES